MNELTKKNDMQKLEQVLICGDLSKLNPEERVLYYNRMCESTGLNPLTLPFSYITLQGKLTLYAGKNATEQLRSLHGISLEIASRELLGDVYVVTARARDKSGRVDEATGAVSIKGLGGDALANSYMKAETKAKRRATLSIVSLGLLDETEVGTIKGAETVEVDMETGEIIDRSSQFKGHIKTFEDLFGLNDKLTAIEVWRELSNEAKSFLNRHLPTDVKKWIAEIVKNAPPVQRAALPAGSQYASVG